MKVKDNPRATPEQVRRLAKKDRDAALAHPCCPKDILLERLSEVDAVLASPAYGLLCIVYPQACEDYLGRVEQDRALVRLGELARRTDKARLILWGLDLLSMESHLSRAFEPKDRSEAVIRRWLMRHALGLTQGREKSEGPWQMKLIENAACAASRLGHEAARWYFDALDLLGDYVLYGAAFLLAGRRPETLASLLCNTACSPRLQAEKLHQYADRLEDYADRRVLWAEKALAKVGNP